MSKENIQTPEEEIKDQNQAEATEEVQEQVAEENQEVESSIEEQPEESAEEKLQAEVAEHKDKYIRLYSEFENFRRRTAREKLDLINTAAEGVISELLSVLDDFDRSQNAITEDSTIDSIKEGMSLVQNKLQKALQQKGLKEMEVAKGDDFDAELHEAITQIPVPEEDLKGKVVDVIEKGYYLGDKVIRFAKVVIGS